MSGLTFECWRTSPEEPLHYIGLHELLGILGEAVEDLRWSLTLEELAPTPEAARFEELAAETQLSTSELLGLITPHTQIIDGKLVGFRDGEQQILLRAVDSTDWDVETPGDAWTPILEIVKCAFPSAMPIPE